METLLVQTFNESILPYMADGRYYSSVQLHFNMNMKDRLAVTDCSMILYRIYKETALLERRKCKEIHHVGRGRTKSCVWCYRLKPSLDEFNQSFESRTMKREVFERLHPDRPAERQLHLDLHDTLVQDKL